MISLRGMNLPERDPGQREVRRELDGAVEQTDLGGRRLGHQPLDVGFEDRQAAELDIETTGLGKSRRQELTRQAFADAEQVGQSAGLLGRRPHLPAVEPDGARPDGDLPLLRLEAADDHLRGALDLPEPDEGGLAQDGERRQLQPLAGLQPLLARDGPDAERLQVAREQDRGRLGNPRKVAVALHVLEWHDEQALDRRGRLRGSGARPKQGRQAGQRQDAAGSTRRHSGDVTLTTREERRVWSVTMITHDGSPTARQ